MPSETGLSLSGGTAAVKGVTGASGKCAEGGLEVGPGRWGTRAPCVARGRGCCGPWRWEDGAALPSGLARQSAGRQVAPSVTGQPAYPRLLRLRFLVGSQLARTCSEVGGTAVERKVHTDD